MEIMYLLRNIGSTSEEAVTLIQYRTKGQAYWV